ncbi:MAG TPA: hypothetical protein VH081_05570 [Solirubrobacteraceae bacterium]|nr:hypothetical protein [Solirubrobacteraceae bacterium]
MSSTDAEREAAMAAWGAWFGKLGPAIVDPGNPFVGSSTVGPSGASESALTGYTVIDADSLDVASGLTEGCPVLGQGGSVDVYETVEVSL